MNIKYYLKPGKADATVIICFINKRNETLKLATGHSISEVFWDKKSQCAKSSMPGAEELNELLLQLKLDSLKQIRIWQLEGINEWNQICPKLKTLFGKGIVPIENKETENFDIEQIFQRFLTAKAAEYKPETLRKYQILKVVLQQFEVHRNAKIFLSDISFSLMEDFRLYLLQIRNNRNDTIYKMLASFKSLIRWLMKNNYQVDSKSLALRQKVKNKYDIVTLTEPEILKIQEVSLMPELTIIRDCFIFMLLTAQRYSDMQQVCPEQFTKNYWKFQSVKTGKEITVPHVEWNKMAFEIAKKNNYNFPKLTQQYFNRALKQVCKKAEINCIVLLKRYKGTNTVLIKKPKYELISSHTARRTAVTMLLSKGVPPTVVMKLTGHSSIQTMMKYENTTSDLLFEALKKL